MRGAVRERDTDPGLEAGVGRRGYLGLFQGKFERNMLTFNPGWDGAGNALAEFTDVRDLQRQVKAAGITPVTAADEASQGPASFMIIDPDGNPVLIDQHV